MDNKQQTKHNNNKKLNNHKKIVFLFNESEYSNTTHRMFMTKVLVMPICMHHVSHPFLGGNIKILFYGERGSHKQLLYSILI